MPVWHQLSLRMTRKQALIVFGVATVAFTVILELVDPSR
jgi:hypothetical protein